MAIAQILDLYARSGRSLVDIGINAAALPIGEADAALNLFGQLGWRVLGGDVYALSKSDRLEPTYDNWFYNGNNAHESVVKARGYLQTLRNVQVYIVFVIADHNA
jgi:hypothetical protein